MEVTTRKAKEVSSLYTHTKLNVYIRAVYIPHIDTHCSFPDVLLYVTINKRIMTILIKPAKDNMFSACGPRKRPILSHATKAPLSKNRSPLYHFIYVTNKFMDKMARSKKYVK